MIRFTALPPGSCLLPLLLCLWIVSPDLPADGVQLPQADGSTLQLDRPASSLVTLSPHLAELVFAAGAGHRLIATTEYSEFPPPAARIPRIGDAFRIDTERILAAHPDLVLAWESGNPKAAVGQLRSLGLRVWSIEIRSPAEIASVLEAIGRAAGTPDSASEAAARVRDRLGALEERYRDVSTVDYFFQIDAVPLFTINGEHLISRGLALCGGRNVFASESSLAFQVSHESVILADPDALLAPWLESQADPLAGWRSWPSLRAVENEALFLLDADRISRATPRMLDALERACERLDGLRNPRGSG
ncbi:MAG: cobalamin-binding protein [Xanthomonadales bacterium]|nr:cobalamin-binding protein [Xanthomonadales bacterium]